MEFQKILKKIIMTENVENGLILIYKMFTSVHLNSEYFKIIQIARIRPGNYEGLKINTGFRSTKRNIISKILVTFEKQW